MTFLSSSQKSQTNCLSNDAVQIEYYSSTATSIDGKFVARIFLLNGPLHCITLCAIRCIVFWTWRCSTNPARYSSSFDDVILNCSLWKSRECPSIAPYRSPGNRWASYSRDLLPFASPVLQSRFRKKNNVHRESDCVALVCVYVNFDGNESIKTLLVCKRKSCFNTKRTINNTRRALQTLSI